LPVRSLIKRYELGGTRPPMTVRKRPDYNRRDMMRLVSPSRLKSAAIVALIAAFWGALFALWVRYAV
jgi:hypothetical protein